MGIELIQLVDQVNKYIGLAVRCTTTGNVQEVHSSPHLLEKLTKMGRATSFAELQNTAREICPAYEDVDWS